MPELTLNQAQTNMPDACFNGATGIAVAGLAWLAAGLAALLGLPTLAVPVFSQDTQGRAARAP